MHAVWRFRYAERMTYDRSTLWQSVHFHERDPGAAPGIQWRKDEPIRIDTDTPLDGERALTPNVVELPGGGYRMYYMGLGPGRPRQASSGYILSAVSSDGENWQKEDGIRLDAGGEGAANCIWGPDVIPLLDGTYRMYFQGRTELEDGSVKSVILSARSDDGLVWGQEPGIRLSESDRSFGAPRCLHLEPSGDENAPLYRMYVSASPIRVPEPDPQTGFVSDRNIASAVSRDGLTFSIEPGVRIKQEGPMESFVVYAPEVLRLGDGSYRMYYAGWNWAPEVKQGSPYHGRIFSARSDDGVHWIKNKHICIDRGGPWDETKASEPCIMELPDGRFRMFYEACDATGHWRIASATASPAT